MVSFLYGLGAVALLSLSIPIATLALVPSYRKRAFYYVWSLLSPSTDKVSGPKKRALILSAVKNITTESTTAKQQQKSSSSSSGNEQGREGKLHVVEMGPAFGNFTMSVFAECSDKIGKVTFVEPNTQFHEV